MRTRRIVVGLGTAVYLSAAAWGSFAQTAAPRPAAPAPARAAPAVATVGELRVPRAEFEARFNQAMSQYQARSGGQIPEEYRAPLKRQLLESLIRQRLIVLEARRRGLTASVAEAEAALKRDPAFQVNGAFDQNRWLAIRSSQPQQFQSAIAELRSTLPAQQLSQTIERENQPTEAELKARAERKLSRASMSLLALRRSEFEGEYPEPTEAEVLAYHKSNPGQYRSAEEVRATVVVVNQPPLADSLAGNEVEVRAWETRMQQRADSAIAAVRRGAKLDAIATLNGWLRQSVVIRPGAFPSYWKGDEDDAKAVLALGTGATLPRAIPGSDGRLIVRADGRSAAGYAPIASVAREVRTKLREQSRARHEERTLRGLYESVKDSLRGPAWRIRYAVLDTASIRIPEPSATEIDRYYRGHIADYSSFDATSGSVVARPLREVREEVRRRILAERGDARMRTTSEKLFEAWSRNRRDPAIEKTMTAVRDVGPLVAGSVVDTGLAGAALTDTMATRWGELGAGVAIYARGLVVYHVHERVESYTPTFDQARPVLGQRLAPRRDREEEAEARRLYDSNPSQFRTGDVVYFTRLVVTPPDLLSITMTRAEVEKFFREKSDRYSAPELARVRHILIEPKDRTPEADRQAQEEAERLLARIRAGENFADLARQHSDDPATRDQGGDVGVFRRGMMLDEFERVAFTMRQGELRGPVRTPAGWHLMECLEYVPRETAELRFAYTNVSGDLAQEKANEIARKRADSLYRVLKTPAQARAAAKRQNFLLIPNEHPIGGAVNSRELVGYFRRLETLRPGEFYPGIQEYRGLGWVVTWIDSIAGPRVPAWEKVREQAVDQVRRQGSLRKLEAKRAELDSLGRAGWSLDSLGALWGGLEKLDQVAPGASVARLGGRDLLDSLAFGVHGKPAALAAGKETGWIHLNNGYVRVRLDERQAPDPVQMAGAVENDRRVMLERNLQATFDKMKARWPVKILDAEMRATALPALPDN